MHACIPTNSSIYKIIYIHYCLQFYFFPGQKVWQGIHFYFTNECATTDWSSIRRCLFYTGASDRH